MSQPQLKSIPGQRTVSFLNLSKLFAWHREEFLSVMEQTISRARFIGGEQLQ
jgi:hypothetical protein